jgi:prepilin-type N-terminal cleavage/methylation domain-containing protein
MNHFKDRHPQTGFTLVEMAVVLAIVALLLGGLLPTISGQIDQQHRRETKKQLDEIQQALIGFAIVNGRLPCPATATTATTDTAHDPGKENCAISSGVIPWATLGVGETDAWGRRFTYVATPIFINAAFTLTSAGTLTIKNSSSGSSVATTIPAIIISHGQNGYGAYLPTGVPLPTTSAGTDEKENTDGTTPFVSHDNTTDFDDLVVWMSPNILLNRMVAAGKLP